MSDSSPVRTRALGVDRAATALGCALLVVVAALAPLLAGITGMRSDSCAGSCRYGVIGIGTGLIAAGPAVVLVAVVVLLLVRRSSTRALWWVPGVGLLAAVAVLAAGQAVVAAGIGA